MNDLKNLLDVVGVFYGGTSKFDDFHNEMGRRRADWIKIQKELKIYPCMGFTFGQRCPFQTCSETAKAFPAPFCEVKLKPRLEIGKIISEAIEFQSY